jgi:hypothetical protein
MNKKTLAGRELIAELIDRQKYLYGEDIPNHGVCMIRKALYHIEILTNCDWSGGGGVYSFNTLAGAMQALNLWMKNGGKSAHPPGNWRKYKSPTGEILNPVYRQNAM